MEVDPPSVSRWADAKFPPSVDTLDQVCRTLIPKNPEMADDLTMAFLRDNVPKSMQDRITIEARARKKLPASLVQILEHLPESTRNILAGAVRECAKSPAFVRVLKSLIDWCAK